MIDLMELASTAGSIKDRIRGLEDSDFILSVPVGGQLLPDPDEGGQ